MTNPALTCCICGCAPAQVFSIRRHVGMVFLQRFVKLRDALCRQHAEELTKSFTLRTLWQGWWGYISFFVNWFVIAANLTVLARASKMGHPTAPEALAARRNVGTPVS